MLSLEAKFYGLGLILGLMSCGLVLVHLGLLTSIIRKSMESINYLPRFQSRVGTYLLCYCRPTTCIFEICDKLNNIQIFVWNINK